MDTLVRWAFAFTSIAAAIAAAAFVVLYSAIRDSNARWDRVELPVLTAFVGTAAIPALIAAVAMSLVIAHFAARKRDALLLGTASVAWLLAFIWVLLCLLAWQMPYVVIGQRL